MDNWILRFDDVSISYRTKRGSLHAVSHASLDVMEGESVALIGESGCGKTTLATSVVGILPLAARIDSGRALYRKSDGDVVDMYALARNEKRLLLWKDVVMMFQASQSSFNPVRRIFTTFVDTVKAHDPSKDDDWILSRSRELLKMVMLDPDKILYSYPHELSGGMKQRTLLALTMILEPRLLILDEPTTALDLITQEKILRLLNDMRRTFGFSMVFITHDLSIVSELADRVVTMYAGKVVESAPVRDFFISPRHPYSDGLLRAIPRLSTPSDELYSIPGTTPDLVAPPAGCLFAPRCGRADERCGRQEPESESCGGRAWACFHPVEEKNAID